jgi:hypothetical protein
MGKQAAAETDDLRKLQDRWLAIPSVVERWLREGDGGRIHGPASPTFREVYEAPRYAWASWFEKEVKACNCDDHECVCLACCGEPMEKSN